MTSLSGEGDVSAEIDRAASEASDETITERHVELASSPEDAEEHGAGQDLDIPQISEILREEQAHVDKEAIQQSSGAGFHKYGQLKDVHNDDMEASVEGAARPGPRPIQDDGDSASIPDDTPSFNGSLISSPSRSATGSQLSTARQRPRSIHPFERRFSARLSPSPLQSAAGTPRAASPAFLQLHSRQSSIASQLFNSQPEGAETPQPPWEVVRWTKLKKITGQTFSEVGKRNYGRPTCLSVAASIVVGTSKGLILVFDYSQILVATIGLGTKAVESGSITSLAISADHTTVAGGHASGHIFTWELARPAKPFLHILPLAREQLQDRKADGHVSGAAVVHIGFLGTRHTALVSADDGGMAFSHLATRGLGSLARTVKTVRLLGRYPQTTPGSGPPRKPSSVLAFAPLPLGNVEQLTDSLGLTALLTPYLLVVVSTTPIAETQFKYARPKELAPHSTLSGCLAWFPSVKLKSQSQGNQQGVSTTKLVYCWSNILTVLEVEAIQSPNKDKPPEAHFKPRSRWKSEEAIVSVQWLSRSVLGVLTISQRLIILEDGSLRQTDMFDLLHKHIYHQDLFSRQLQPVVEQLDEQDVSMHGVVADAFHMSFKAYKGRLFLLGFNDVSIGTLSNWADRLLALMEEGDFVAAIELATSYYNGDADRLTVGLPEDGNARHAMVHEKLLEMISASLRYTFNKNRVNQEESGGEVELQALAKASFTACMSMAETDFLFEDVYDAYEAGDSAAIFFEVLEPYTVSEEIKVIPPNVLKELVTYYAQHNRGEQLEEMICRLDTMTMDLNQITSLCKQYRLYDALIYVWNQAIGDYITPLIELLSLIREIQEEEPENDEDGDIYLESAMKIFPYLAYTFTSRIYPTGEPMSEQAAISAKQELYGYLLAGRPTPWPPGSKNVFATHLDDDSEPLYPYLTLLLAFDTSSVMSMFNEAFEDPFLEGSSSFTNGTTNGSTPTQSHFGNSPTRQTIIGILFDVFSSNALGPENSIYLDIFIARNLPKFPQFINLPGSALRKVLEDLCNYPSEDVADDCQLSVEYLLSFYHPSDLEALVPLFKHAGFHRVLKSVYRGARDYPKLLEAYFNDPEDEEAVFECIASCLRPNSGLTTKQIKDFFAVIIKFADHLARIDTVQLAITLNESAPSLLARMLEALDEDSHTAYVFLRTLLEPKDGAALDASLSADVRREFGEQYVQGMCRYNPLHVADYISLLKSGDLRLDHVLPAMESGGVIDAAVVLMARDGRISDAMTRLVKHLGTLEVAIVGLIEAAAESPDVANTEEAVDDLLAAVEKYAKVGIWLCRGQTQISAPQRAKASKDKRRQSAPTDPEAELSDAERLWLDLLSTIVDISKHVTRAQATHHHASSSDSSAIDLDRISATLRTTVQQSFTALLTSTTESNRPPSTTTTTNTGALPPFLLILRAFLTRAARSSPSLSDLRLVLHDIFAAYTFEETVLSLSNQFLDKDLFLHVDDGYARRLRGWRPRGQNCEGCGRRVWGPGAGNEIWEAWEEKQAREEQSKAEQKDVVGGGAGKKKAESSSVLAESSVSASTSKQADEGSGSVGVDATAGASATVSVAKGKALGSLVVFACRHLWHQRCLEEASAGAEGAAGDTGKLRCPLET